MYFIVVVILPVFFCITLLKCKSFCFPYENSPRCTVDLSDLRVCYKFLDLFILEDHSAFSLIYYFPSKYLLAFRS